MKNIAIIPARSGSKRIKNKNIKQFIDKPIITYSINTALKSKLFDRIIVSTDSIEIADISKKYGAEVPFYRSKDNSNDTATTLDVLYEVIQKLSEENYLFDNLCCIYPTSPLLNCDTIINAFDKLISNKEIDLVLGAVKYSYPIQRSFEITNNKIKFNFPEYINTRSQDLKEIFHDAGSFYFYKKSFFEKKKQNPFETATAIELLEIEVQDIDNHSDWEIAELKFKHINHIDK